MQGHRRARSSPMGLRLMKCPARAWMQREPNGLHEESFGERPRVALGQCADFVQTLTLHWRQASVRSARVISRR